MLPLSPGRIERHGFEYYRQGTLSLYAALDVKSGKVHGKTAARHILHVMRRSRDIEGSSASKGLDHVFLPYLLNGVAAPRSDE